VRVEHRSPLQAGRPHRDHDPLGTGARFPAYCWKDVRMDLHPGYVQLLPQAEAWGISTRPRPGVGTGHLA